MVSDPTALTESSPTTSKPGSAEARARGCRCPAARNNYGASAPFAPGTLLGGEDGGWYIALGCVMHAKTTLPGALFSGVERAVRDSRPLNA
jgi:hypothetical protein